MCVYSYVCIFVRGSGNSILKGILRAKLGGPDVRWIQWRVEEKGRAGVLLLFHFLGLARVADLNLSQVLGQEGFQSIGRGSGDAM